MILNRQNRSRELPQAKQFEMAVVVPIATVVLGGCLAIAPQAIALAQITDDRQLFAQRVYEGLPPPPSERYSEDEDEDEDEQERYLVYINGDSPLLLEIVQRVIPEAFVGQYKGRDVIEIGAFEDESEARRRVEELSAEYIDADIATIKIRRSIDDDRDDDRDDERFEDKQYLVLIPTPEEDLLFIEDKVRQLAPDLPYRRGIFPREEPRGSYIAVGPFENRRAAERWRRYLRDFGLREARVYYGR